MNEVFAVTDWWTGGLNPYLRLDIRCGPMEATVSVDSRTAREIAIDVLASQGPYLLFQPPNDSMKERTDRSTYPLTASSDRLVRRSKRWPKQKRLNREARELVEEIVDRYSASTAEAIAHELLRALEAER